MGKIRQYLAAFLLIVSMLGFAGVQDASAASCSGWITSSYHTGTSWVVTGRAQCSGRTGVLRVSAGGVSSSVSVPYNGTASARAVFYSNPCRNTTWGVSVNGISQQSGFLYC